MVVVQRTEYRIKPTLHQDEFLFAPEKYTAFIGGVGSGKTWAGSVKSILQCQPGQDGMVLAPTYPMMRDVTQRTLFNLLDTAHIRYEYSKSEETAVINGARVLFRSADTPERLRGPNLNWFWGDEAALFSKAIWPIMLGRLRVGKPKAWITTTPAGFNWVYQNFIERRDPQYRVITASTRENTHLPAEYIKDLEDNYAGDFAAQEIEGRFVAWEGLVYPGFSRAIHVCKPFKIPDSWPCVRGIDYGYTNPFVCLWGRLDEDGRLYIVDEHYQRKMLIEAHAEAILRRGDTVMWTVADHDAQDNAEMRAHGIATRNAQKEVVRGIQKVASRLQVAGDGRPRLMIFDNCVETIKELETYRWQDQKDDRDAKEEPLKQADHACLVAGTMVATSAGSRPIEDIRVGDYVLTRDGFKEVLGAGLTELSARVVTVKIGDTTLTATPDHQIFANGEWVTIDSLRYYIKFDACIQRQSFSTVLNSGDIPNRKTGLTESTSRQEYLTNSKASVGCTRKSGSHATGKFQRVMTSITSMATRLITKSAIWLASNARGIEHIILTTISRLRDSWNIWNASVPWPRLGIQPLLAASGISNTVSMYGNRSSHILESVNTAEKHTIQGPRMAASGSVPMHARCVAESNQAWITKPAFAMDAERVSPSTNTLLHVTARVNVLGWREEKERKPVYNLTIKEAHEFFANGLLVHNCDALRYMVMELDNRRVYVVA